MLRKVFFAALTIGLLSTASLALAQTGTNASTTLTSVTFPIAELGGCDSKDACRVYCDVTEHQEACYTYALSHGLMKKDQIEKARELNKAVGPGGCSGKACREYCDNPLNETVCKAFAEEHHFTKPMGSTTPRMASTTRPIKDERMGSSTLPEQAAIRAKIINLLKTTAGPGGCTTPDSCKKYCADTAHNAECLQFAKDNGLMKPGDIERGESFIRMRDGDEHGSSTKPMLKAMGSSTLNKIPRPELKDGSSTLKRPPMPLGSTTSMRPEGDKVPKPQMGNGGPDMEKPPFKCTPAQDSEGACDPDNLPGAAQIDSGLGGAVYTGLRGVLHYFFGF